MKLLPSSLRVLAIVLFGSLATHSARAVVIADYDFTDSSIPSASIDSDVDSAATDLALGVGFPQTGTSNQQSGISTITGNPGNSLFLRRTNVATEADAVTGDKYFTFTITPGTGPISIDSFILDYRREGVTSATNLFVRTDAGGDNYATNIATLTLSGTGSFQTISPIAFAGVPSLQNVAASTPVILRFYAYGGADATSILRIDNLIINGNQVPESGTGLLALAGLGLLWQRRQRTGVARL